MDCHARSVVFVSCVLLAFFSVATAQSYRAQCVFSPTTEYGKPLNISGQLTFYVSSSDNPLTLVTAQITGNLGTKDYAISINQFGDLTNLTTGSSAGPRFQGGGSSNHSCPPSTDRYAGDLGNWPAVNGVINHSQNISLLELNDPQYSIVGLSAVLYDSPDNCSNPVGSDSKRLAVCVIGITNVDNNPSLNANQNLQNAVAVLGPTSNCGANCSGTVWLINTAQGVRVVARVAGLQNNTKHGFHIHQYGDMSAADGTSAGAHWNPNGRNHELPGTTPRHVGDLGNIQSFDQTGLGWYDYIDANIPNIYSLLGRSVVIHADVDHGSGAGCDQAGTAGKRLMIGVIGLANDITVAPPVPISVNNTYHNIPCVTSPTPAPAPSGGDDNGGLKAGVAIGWILVGVLGLVVIPGMIAYYWLKLRPQSGNGTFYDRY